MKDQNLLRKMCDLLKHRGPDETGRYEDGEASLGIDRLSIIDLSTGSQPIHNEKETVWLVFNGEIYNFKELRADLENDGHDFYSESDTEVIAHAYEKWGEGCLHHLRGMFALALWDTEKKRLLLARDRFGKKPLYYSIFGGIFFFASEPKAILAYDGLPRRVNWQAIDHFFTYAYIPSPLTAFEGIYKLPPGHYLTYTHGKAEVTTYWDAHFDPSHSLDEDGWIDLLYRGLEEAVKLRLRSDVPLGGFISGGIDSSTIVAVMARLSEEPIRTVSIGFDEGWSELPHARLVAESLGTDHKEHVVKAEAYKILPRLVWHYDEPHADHSMIPTFSLSEVSRRYVTVSLSGEGGDELFMGYTFLQEPRFYGTYMTFPRRIRRALLRTMLSLPVEGPMVRAAQHAYEKDYGGQDPLSRYIFRVTLYTPEQLSGLYSDDLLRNHRPGDSYEYLRSLLNRHPGLDLFHKLDYATIRSYLEEGILVKVDRMSMAVGLEVRCPFLDNVLFSIVEKMPSNFKIHNGAKYILKKMLLKKGLIPKEIIFRKKQGFGAPVEHWLKGEWRDVALQLVESLQQGGRALFSKEHIRELFAHPSRNANRLFALSVFALWYKMYVEREELAVSPKGVSHYL